MSLPPQRRAGSQAPNRRTRRQEMGTTVLRRMPRAGKTAQGVNVFLNEVLALLNYNLLAVF
jgi:hypothetical protein